jgi:outer membrane biosynthesis protein TonB
MPEKDIKPTVAQKAPTPEEEKSSSAPAELPKPKPQQDPNEPGFRGNQQKTQLSGSISRKGRSALNVANTAMGRYQAALSRAVEAEWHKNCTKYRDFITPGILTIRFVIGPDGAVRSISVVEMVDAGEVQKGFTLGSIRQAKIPPIPAELKAEIDDDPIELIYNFYF